MQLAKYLHILHVKPSNKMYVLDDLRKTKKIISAHSDNWKWLTQLK